MKLHIGCGKKYLSGYKHIDVIPYDHVDYVCDVRSLDMIADCTVSEIYACHVLEHIERKNIIAVLREWCRVLIKGGNLRVAVPDFAAIVCEYDGTNLEVFQGLLYGGQTYDYNFHHMSFDYGYLTKLLHESGFNEVERYDWKEFLSEGYDDYSRAYLPHMDFEKGRAMSLNLIAKKIL